MGKPSNVSTAAINPRVGHRQYLEAEFNAGTSVVKMDYWAYSTEKHHNDGFHYHCSLKLIGCKKWLSVKIELEK